MPETAGPVGPPLSTPRSGRRTSCCATAPPGTCGRSGPTTPRRLQPFHARQSEESIYLRFFAPMPRAERRATSHRFTNVDHVDRVAFVITVGDDIIGIGR